MKTEQPVLITSVLCTANPEITKHHFVSFDGNLGRFEFKSLGVCNADTTQGEMIPVMAKGIALVYSETSIAVNEPVQTADGGTAVPYTEGPLEGYAMDEATGGGQLIRVLLA